MTEYILILLALVVVSFSYLKIALKYKIIDKPNNRSSHAIPTIRGGGILFLFAVLLFFFTNNFQYPYFVLGILLIAGVSFIDDLITLSSKVRLPFQFIASFFLFYQIGIGLSPIWVIAILLIIAVLFINIYNFMDGINGITGMYSMSILISFYIINKHEQIVSDQLIIYLFLSLLVFGYYNFRKKARFFAGDIGSISMAIIILFIGSKMIFELESPLILYVIVVYGADGLWTLTCRKIRGEKITEAHRDHMYQKLVDVKKISHLKVSALYACIQLLVNFIIYKTYKLDLYSQYIIAGVLTFSFSLTYLILLRITKVKAIKKK